MTWGPLYNLGETVIDNDGKEYIIVSFTDFIYNDWLTLRRLSDNTIHEGWASAYEYGVHKSR